MADIRPFKGLHYNPAVAGAAATLVAPPYDVVSEADRRQLYARSPFNIAHVDYGAAGTNDGEADNRYTRAAALLASWRRDGVLVGDSTARLYVYDQEFSLGSERFSRRAVFARLRLSEWDEGVVLPHEYTGSAAKADRLHLIEATGVHLSPILALHTSSTAALPGDADLGEPLLDAELPGERHTLRPLSQEAARRFCDAIAGQKLYIADGHHRYETALNYRNHRRDASNATWTGEEPENFILAALVDAADAGLIVLPTDRVLRLKSGGPFEALLAGHFHTTRLASLAELEKQLDPAGREGPAFGLVSAGGSEFRLVAPRDLTSILALTPADHGDAWRRLDVIVLHHALLPALGYEEAPENIDYTESHEDAAAKVSSGEWDLAVLLNPTPVQQIVEVADTGERMPRKTTFFYPKLSTGVLMLPLE